MSPRTLLAYGIPREEGPNVWEMPPGRRCFDHERNPWPISPGQPFNICTEEFGDRLAMEALTNAPSSYEHDDKENIANGQGVASTPDPHEDISIIPASLYRQPIGDTSAFYHALYDESPQAYGVDGNNGTD